MLDSSSVPQNRFDPTMKEIKSTEKIEDRFLEDTDVEKKVSRGDQVLQ